MNILAIDPGSIVGFAHSNGHHGTWHVTIAGEEHRGNRLIRLYDHLEEAFYEWGIDKLVFENASFGAWGQEQAKVAHNEMRGLMVYFAAKHQLPWYAVNPMSLKKFATGNGHAIKEQMIRACKTLLGIEVESDDVADAIWMLTMAQTGELDVERRLNKKSQRRRRGVVRQPKLF